MASVIKRRRVNGLGDRALGGAGGGSGLTGSLLAALPLPFV
jgi:hypothetical protein